MISIFRKEERDLSQEVASASPRIYIDESDSDEESESKCPSSTTLASDSSDYSLIDAISDNRSLSGRSFSGYMMILKGYTLKQILKTPPRNPETMQSRKMQHRFTQAYKQDKPSETFSTASITPQKIHTSGPSVECHPLSTAMAHLNIIDSKPVVAASPSSRLTELSDTKHLNSTAQGKDKVGNERPVDSDDGKEKMDFGQVSHFPRKCTPFTPAPPGNDNAPSVSEGRFMSAIQNDNSFPHTPAVDCNGLHSLPMERSEPSPELVVSESASKSEERHIPSSSSLVPPLPLLFSAHFPDGMDLLANDNFSGSAFISNPFALQSFLQQVPLAWPSAPASSRPSLSSTLCNGFNANLTTPVCPSLGPYNYDSLAVSMTTPFIINSAVQVDWNQDVEMVDVETAFERERSLRFTTTATQYVRIYEHPTVSVGGVSTIPAVGRSSDGCPAIVGPTQSTFGFATHHSTVSVETFATQSISVFGSQGFSSTIESYPSALSTPAPERPTELFVSTSANPSPAPHEMLPVEQHVYETTTKGISHQLNTTHTNAENEKNTRESMLYVSKTRLTTIDL